MCTGILRHKYKIARCEFFEVSWECQGLLGMPDIELLGMLKIMCEEVGGWQADRQFNPQLIKPSSALNWLANTGLEIRSGNVDIISTNPNMSDYFKLSTD